MDALQIAAGLVLLALGRGAASPPAGLEYDVKAAFVYNFAKFVQWPADAFPRTDAPLTICIVGTDPFGPSLDETLKGEHLDGHPLAAVRHQAPPPAGTCHVLFVSASEEGRYGELLAAIDSTRTLTVGDTISFLDAGGYLAFYLDNGRVRFAVNSDLAGADGLDVSSKLLRVAMPHKPRQGDAPR